jgi:hypothetical protein
MKRSIEKDWIQKINPDKTYGEKLDEVYKIHPPRKDYDDIGDHWVPYMIKTIFKF